MTRSSETEAKFQRGLSLHEQGRLSEAAAIYQEILAAEANHVNALHWMGVVAYQNGDHEKAASLISRALAIDPGFAAAHSNLGNVLVSQGRPDEAIASYDAAIAISPDYAGSHANRGAALNDLRRFDEALASFSQAIALRPDFAEAHINRGTTFHETGRFFEAIASYDKAIALNPGLAGAHHNRGISLKALRRFGEALASHDRAIALAPAFAQAHCNRGVVLNDLHRFGDAVASYDKAIALNQDYADAHYNRGVALGDLRRFDEALAAYDRAILLRPNFAEAHGNRGYALHELARFGEARQAYDQAVALKPDCDGALFNRALLNLISGMFEEGWKDYEWRSVVHDPYAGRAFRQPRLTSLDQIRGKSVLVFAEQGLGDTLQFFRYARLLQEGGARVLFAPQPVLRSLLAANKYGVEIVAADDKSIAFDYQIPLLSLPLLFGTVAQTIPAAIPYLFADERRGQEWRHRIGEAGFKIGICWQGNRYKHDFGRSFPVAHFQDLSGNPGIRLISLQKGGGAKQLETLPAGLVIETLGESFDAGPDAFVDTAAVMMSLDLVITADTAVAHVAAVLGVATWVMLPHVADWRWLLGRSDTPWYPTMRLFRQTAAGDWAGAFRRVKEALLAELE